MANVQGTVVSKRRDGAGIKVGDTWYNGSAAMLANVEWKGQVDMEVDDKRNITSVNSTGGGGSAAPAAKNTGGNDWDKRQEVIVFQSARNAAIELFNSLAAQGAVSIPTKKEDKYGAAIAFIDLHTATFHKQAMAVYTGSNVDDALNEVE